MASSTSSQPVTTTVTELPESRVRVQAEVPAQEVEKRVAQAARGLARNLRVPGFRAGKAPPPVVIKRVGREAVLDEAVRDSLAGWYAAAIDAARIVPVGEPELDMGALPAEGEPLRFSIEIGVRPKAALGAYKDLEVGRREPEVTDEQVQEEVDRLRERGAKLETVERPAQRGDFVVMDYLGSIDGTPFEGGEGRDQMVELGSGRLVPGFEAQLEGAAAGEERTIHIAFPEDYHPELASKHAEFAVTVKEVKAKELPELDDELAAEAGFDTLDELRADIRERMSEAQATEIESEFRQAALDSAVKAATVELPDALVEARSRELWEQMVHTLSHQGISREAYLRIAGQEEDQIVEAGKEDAAQTLRREAVLAAIVEAEGIEPTDEEVMEAVEQAAPEGGSSQRLFDRLKSAGRIDELRTDLAQKKAVDLVADTAKAITVEQAQARDKLWTPDKGDRPEGARGGLWTPGA
jgi:trigger factor